jgi:hypothetical protein
VDRLLDEASSAPSQPARLLLLQQAAATLAADVALVPLYRVLDRYAFAGGLDFTPPADRRIRAQEMSWTAPPPGARLP